MPVQLIVIGSSLGGVKALQTILSQLPANFSIPVAIAQHRHADERGLEGALTSFLQQTCALPISEPHDNEGIEGHHIYLAPADYHLLVESRNFSLSADGPVNHARPSIDLLFESAAEVHHDRLFALILSGSGCDGERGAAAVRRLGGELVIQDPLTAECDLLPRLVLRSVTPDRLIGLSDIGPYLIQLAHQAAILRNEPRWNKRRNSVSQRTR